MASCMRKFLDLSFRSSLPAALARQPRQLSCIVVPQLKLHTSQQTRADFDPETYHEKLKKERAFIKYNDIKYPPTKEGEAPRPAEICHERKSIYGSHKRNWPCAVLVRGLSIDEAIKQCEFSKRAFPKIIKEVLIEAQEKAVLEFNVEFKSNLWVCDSFVTKAPHITTMKRNRGKKINKIKIRKCHYFVRLREGSPPEHYYPGEPTGQEKLEEYIKEQRERRILHSL